MAQRSAVAQPPAAEGQALSIDWQWPLRGPVQQTFSAADRTRQGIRIGGALGQDVVAAAAGTVAYSGGGLKGYGNLIIVRHRDDFLTAYGFNRRLLAAEGDRVEGGQPIAEVGQPPGGKTQLHFEIRKDGAAVDPLMLLPSVR